MTKSEWALPPTATGAPLPPPPPAVKVEVIDSSSSEKMMESLFAQNTPSADALARLIGTGADKVFQDYISAEWQRGTKATAILTALASFGMSLYISEVVGHLHPSADHDAAEFFHTLTARLEDTIAQFRAAQGEPK